MNDTKICTKCHIEKPLTAFSKHIITKDGYSHQCKQCNRERSRIFRGTPSGIYTNIQSREKFRNNKPFDITREDFIEWYNSQKKQCIYCGISYDNAYLMRKYFGAHGIQLSIDCKENDLGYTLDNIVLACDRCNFIKSNIFTYEEMLEIGKKYIKPKWSSFPEITKKRSDKE